jgi:hypothetical protein
MTRGRSALRALALAFALAGTVPGGAEDTVASLRERIVELQNAGKLGVRGLVMCRSVATYGQYVPVAARSVPKGSTIYFYYEPENVYTQREREAYRIWYTQDIVLLGKSGAEVFRSEEALSFTHLGLAPVLDLFATNELDLGDLAPGEYRYRVVLRDRLRGAEATAELAFTVTAS